MNGNSEEGQLLYDPYKGRMPRKFLSLAFIMKKLYKKSINCYWRSFDLSYGLSIWKRNV